jgi:transcriptional adapter 2-beta
LSHSSYLVPPEPPSFTPVALEPSEQQELAYAPLRDDFEKEFDNDAEKIISNISVHNDEEPIERDLKLAHIDMYNRKIAERERRKSFARNHSLIGGKMRLNNIKRKYTKDERELRGKYKPLARLVDSSEYEKFIGLLKKEQELIERVKDLQRCRINGITKLEDSVEVDLIRQDKSKENNPDTSKDITGDMPSQVISPGSTLLSQSERKLCNALSLQPLEYLNIKSEVLTTHCMRQNGLAVKPSLPKTISQSTKHHLIKFFYKSGWIS